MAALRIIQVAESIIQPAGWRATITCGLKAVLFDTFSNSPAGITTATQHDYDILLEKGKSRHGIKTSFIPLQCVRYLEAVFPPSEPCPLTAYLVSYSKQPMDSKCSDLLCHLPSSHVITTPKGNKILLSRLKETIQHAQHHDNLQRKLEKDNNRVDGQFDYIDWQSFHSALKKHPWSHRISISKLSHQLWSTNVRNGKFNGQSNICPICEREMETWHHVISCE
jgi:hypothetical protein